MKEGEKYCSWKVDKTFLGKGGFFLSTVSYHKVMTSYLFVHLFFFIYLCSTGYALKTPNPYITPAKEAENILRVSGLG